MKTISLLSAFVLCSGVASAQLGLGTNSPSPSAVLDLASQTKGFLLPRMTGTQRINISSPANGLIVYQTNDTGTSFAGLYIYSAGAWTSVGALAENGLTAASGKIGLGGSLTQSTTIAAGDEQLNLTGTDGNPGGRVLTVNLTPANPLVSGSDPIASEMTVNYPGTENTGSIEGILAGSHSVSSTTSTDYQAQGSLNEAQVTGGGNSLGGAFRAVASNNIATANNTSGAGGNGDVIVGSSSATNFSTGGANWNGVGVDGYTNYSGVSTSGRTAGGIFEGRSGGTEFGVIGTLDNNTYETFFDATLAGMHIGVVAANRNATANNQYALYGMGNVRLTSDAAGTVTIDNGSTTVEPSAKLQVNSTSQGVLLPRMSSSQADAISNKAEGLMIYVNAVNGGTITAKGWYGWNGSAWEKLNP